MLINSITLVLIIFSSFFSIAQTFPVNAIFQNGPIDKRINIVFLGDGYKISEMGKYHQDVQIAINSIFLQSPYKEYKNLFNVFAIDVPSNESGTSHPGTANDCGSYQNDVFYRDTYFNTTFDVGNIHRLLVYQDYSKVFQVLTNNFPAYDLVLMVVNHEWYGGSGGMIAVFSTNVLSSEIALHEAGHTFAQLFDEYDYGYPNPVQVEGFNVTSKTHRDSILWKDWILSTTPVPTPQTPTYSSVIGLFEGAFYSSKDIYRPKLNCKMRSLTVPFCDVCVEQHIRSVFSYIDLIENYSPNTDTVTLYTNNFYSFKIEQLPVTSSQNHIEWFLNNELIAQNEDSISIYGSELTIGTHTLIVKVKHITPLVIYDPENLLENSVKWHIKTSEPTNIHDDDLIPQNFALMQNHPNPFNPSTKIKYSLPSTGRITIKIFDLLGNEVLTLVDEEKSPGNYEFLFKGDMLPSGIYFYRMQAKDFIETKKLVLIK